MPSLLERFYLKASTPFREFVDQKFQETLSRLVILDERLDDLYGEVQVMQVQVQALSAHLGAELARIEGCLATADPTEASAAQQADQSGS